MKNHSPAGLEARLYLHGLSKPGPMRFLCLIEAFGSAFSALAVLAGAWRILGVSAETTAVWRSPTVQETAGETLRWLEGPRRYLLMQDDPGYPTLFAEIVDVPPLLYVESALEAPERPQLAMVSSHCASPVGLDTAQSFMHSLAQGGFVTTSGLVLGIDDATHKGALEVGGATVAVFGTGLRRLYPCRHEALARRIVEGGDMLISELPLGNPLLPVNFPRRNHIISGLSLGVLVIEASPASGSLIIARLAVERGHEVHVISGSIHHPGVRNHHQLIRGGVLLVESVEHVPEALRGWAQAELAETPAQPLPHLLSTLLHTVPHTSEDLAVASDTTLPDVLVMLSKLELDGRAVCKASTWVHRFG